MRAMGLGHLFGLLCASGIPRDQVIQMLCCRGRSPGGLTYRWVSRDQNVESFGSSDSGPSCTPAASASAWLARRAKPLLYRLSYFNRSPRVCVSSDAAQMRSYRRRVTVRAAVTSLGAADGLSARVALTDARCLGNCLHSTSHLLSDLLSGSRGRTLAGLLGESPTSGGAGTKAGREESSRNASGGRWLSIKCASASRVGASFSN